LPVVDDIEHLHFFVFGEAYKTHEGQLDRYIGEVTQPMCGTPAATRLMSFVRGAWRVVFSSA
jgi:hypothetical protein